MSARCVAGQVPCVAGEVACVAGQVACEFGPNPAAPSIAHKGISFGTVLFVVVVGLCCYMLGGFIYNNRESANAILVLLCADCRLA